MSTFFKPSARFRRMNLYHGVMRSNPPWFDAESKAVPVGRWLFSIGQTTPHQSRLPAYQELLMWLTFMCLAWRANEWFMVWLSRDATTPE